MLAWHTIPTALAVGVKQIALSGYNGTLRDIDHGIAHEHHHLSLRCASDQPSACSSTEPPDNAKRHRNVGTSLLFLASRLDREGQQSFIRMYWVLWNQLAKVQSRKAPKRICLIFIWGRGRDGACTHTLNVGLAGRCEKHSTHPNHKTTPLNQI